jgi:FkbM family methyltransferase
MLLKRTVRRAVSYRFREFIRGVGRQTGTWKVEVEKEWSRCKLAATEGGAWVRCGPYQARVPSGPTFYYLHDDIFTSRIYHFDARRPDPLILDCGSNIGISILYFKGLYPESRIIGFEPDPSILPYLKENVERNALRNVSLVHAALATDDREVLLSSDGTIGSAFASKLPAEVAAAWPGYRIPCVRLRDYLAEPVDFVKMNIEGAEWEVLADSRDRLANIREMVIEYHHLPGLPRTLHQILTLLHDCGFEYLVSDFGLATYGRPTPPVALEAEARYFRHISARRRVR